MQATPYEAFGLIMIGILLSYFVYSLLLNSVYKGALRMGASERERIYRQSLKIICERFNIRWEDGEWIQENNDGLDQTT